MTRTLLIYANCQGDEFGEMVRSSAVLAGHVTVERIFLGHMHEYLAQHGHDEASARLGRVTMVWEQSSDANREERDQLKDLLPRTARWVRFPALTCSTLWPFGVSDPRPGGGPLFPYSDTLAARIWREQGGSNGYLAEPDDDALFDRYMELSEKLMPDLDRVLERDMMQWRRRDADSDIRMSGFLADGLQREQLFFTAGRPSWRSAGEILQQIVAASIEDAALRDAAVQELDQFGTCYVGNDALCAPIHPAVARNLQLAWYQPDAVYRWKGSFWNFREWVIRCIRLSPHCD